MLLALQHACCTYPCVRAAVLLTCDKPVERASHVSAHDLTPLPRQNKSGRFMLTSASTTPCSALTERDSPKAHVLVVLFIILTGGLLATAGLKHTGVDLNANTIPVRPSCCILLHSVSSVTTRTDRTASVSVLICHCFVLCRNWWRSCGRGQGCGGDQRIRQWVDEEQVTMRVQLGCIVFMWEFIAIVCR